MRLEKNSRDIRFDWMRGVAILLMMIGHIPIEGFAYRLIYSFHMPLFFILSGYFAKDEALFAGGNSLIINLLQRLIAPLALTICLIVVIQYLSGQMVGHVTGPLWFLLALFWARAVYGCLQPLGTWSLPVALIIGLAAYCASGWWMESRIFIIHGVCALPFVAIGGSVKKLTSDEVWREKHSTLIRFVVIICIICWVLAVAFSHLEMRACSFSCWPLDIIGACGGTLVLWFTANFLLKKEKIRDCSISRAIIWCGRFSLAVLCMQTLEWKALLPFEQMICSGWVLMILRLMITIGLTAIAVYTPYIKKIYR